MSVIMHCPNCRKALTEQHEKSEYRPFCSERCKLLDLGDWVSERHAIPGEPAQAGLNDPNTNNEISDPNLIDVDFLTKH